MISLEDAKLYLRIDSNDEDTLIVSFIDAASEICESILRRSISAYNPIPDTVKHALLFIVSNLYESRETLDMKKVLETAKLMLYPYREESW